jgi:TRAP-type C4-dicarboxylate transport system permease small subunit
MKSSFSARPAGHWGRTALDALYAGSSVLAGLCLVMIFLIMLAGAVGRTTGFLIPGVDEITAWLCAACAFLALGATFRSGDLVRVGFLIDWISPHRRREAEGGALVIAASYVGYVLYASVRFVYESWQFGDMSSGLLRVPLWIPQVPLVIGALILFIAILEDFVRVLRNQLPTYVLEERKRTEERQFSQLT